MTVKTIECVAPMFYFFAIPGAVCLSYQFGLIFLPVWSDFHTTCSLLFKPSDLCTENGKYGIRVPQQDDLPDAHPLFHSDRGFQYTSKQFKAKLDEQNMEQSMSCVGKCIDNGPMEGKILRSELN